MYAKKRETLMSKNNKIEKDFQDSNSKIRRMAEEEIKKIEADANQIKKEAEKIGEEAENSINEYEGKTTKKNQ